MRLEYHPWFAKLWAHRERNCELIDASIHIKRCCWDGNRQRMFFKWKTFLSGSLTITKHGMSCEDSFVILWGSILVHSNYFMEATIATGW